MPDLVSRTRGTSHSIDSALLSLRRLGMEMDRIVLEADGRGGEDGRISTQSPGPGEPLPTNGLVHLVVEGWGGVESLPYPLRDEDPVEFRADRLFAVFDNPTLKLRHHVRMGSGFLDLHPHNLPAQRRWLEEVFQVDPEPWPREMWFGLVRLLAALPSVAGRGEAVGLAYQLLFGLTPCTVELREKVLRFDPGQRTRLGELNSTLGVNAVLGSGLGGLPTAVVRVGPVSLETYLRHQEPELQALRRKARRLALPAHMWSDATEDWTVGSPDEAAPLGNSTSPLRLGLNTWLAPSAHSNGPGNDLGSNHLGEVL